MKLIPQEIKVGPYVYPVIQRKHFAAGDAKFGKQSLWDEEILIDADLKETGQWHTLLHECVHAMQDCFHCFAEASDDEKVDQIAIALFLFLQDNHFLDE